MEDFGDVMDASIFMGGTFPLRTVITGIELHPNGDAQFFQVVGRDFTCGFSTSVGGVCPGEAGWLTFSGYGGHNWRIRKLHESTNNDSLEEK